ncbi:10699_t:CDS:2 [Rhizophagus irregularis]|nr:10699_t:CDS:2 [Rhizophagus irregularis]
MNQSDYAHNSNFTETNERTPSNVPSYASLVIRRRNNRRIRHERHGIIIDTIPVDYLGQAHKWTDTDIVSSYKENMSEPCSDACINDRTNLWEN